MGGRFIDFFGQGEAVDRPAAVDVPTLTGAPGACVMYYSNDSGGPKILSIYDETEADWFDIDTAALASLSFATLPDVDWSTPPTDGQIFQWDLASGKLIPVDKPTNWTTEQLQDLVGAMGANGTGTTFSYDDGTGFFTFNCTITQYTDELAQDAVAAAFAAGTHTGVTVTYDDVGNAFDLDVVYATTAEIHAGSAGNKSVRPEQLLESMEPVAVAYAATIALDLNTGFNFDISDLTGDLLLDDPTNAKEGQSGVIGIVQDGTGGWDVTYGADWRFPNGAAANPVASGANEETLISYIVRGGLVYATVSTDFIA